MRYLLNVHVYDVFMYFHDLYFLLMIFGRVQYKQWDLGIAWFQFWGKQAVGDIESPLQKVFVIRVEKKQAWWFLFETFLEYWKFKFYNSVPTWKNYIESSSRKGFQNMEINIICEKIVLMDFINPFGVSDDVMGYINIQISTYIYFLKHTIVVHEFHYSNCS